MGTLHLAPSDTAGGSLRQAIRDASHEGEVLSFFDDLSCGPIASDDALERAKWWSPFYSDRNVEADLSAFWDRVSTTDDRLVVWFSRHRASELAFYLALAARLGDQPYECIDVADRQLPFKRQDGSSGLTSMQSVGITNPDGLKSLLGSKQSVTAQLREESCRTWQRLKAENAPFRVVTAAGLASAPIDYFDQSLLERATAEWRTVGRVIGETMGYNCEPYIQVGDVMLKSRIVALVDEGKLFTTGDPRDIRSQVRLSGQSLR
jgi:hypothetical protein